MKLITGFLGCALAAGLMTFAAGQAQAGVVIDNTLYSPFKLKVTIGVYKNDNVINKVTITSKQVLKMLGYSAGTQLAINTGDAENNDIYVINKDTVLENLTADGILTADVNELLETTSNGKNGQFKYKSSGVVSLNLYSNPQFTEESIALLIVSSSNLDQAASEEASDYWFEISGLYSYTEKGSAIKSGKQSLATSFKNVGVWSGMGYDTDLNNPKPTTVSGTGSAKGSGKVPVGG